MNKICTSVEQSKKLMELGIDVNTADMFYPNAPSPVPCVDDGNPKGDVYIPAWSISALLGLMPMIYEYENDPEDGGCQPNLCKGWDNNQWHIVYRTSLYITDWYDDPLDAAFEMVVWLKENGKL